MHIMTYHLHTEYRRNLASIVSRHFANFTILRGTGYWKGGSEPSALVEVVTDNRSAVEALAHNIKFVNHQQAVLVESMRTSSHLV